MIVQPASTNPRDPVRRWLRAVALVLPLVLLVAVAGVGLLGPKPVAPAPRPSAALDASPHAPASPPAAAGVALGRAPAFPAVSADLAVHPVTEALARLAGGFGSPIAVAGTLVALEPPDACPAAAGDTRGPLSPLCERRARLVVSDPTAAPGPHLHVEFPPGVRLPPALEDAVPDEPLPVVIVGRGDGAACTPGQQECGEAFTADRVTWAGGAPFDPGPVFDAGLEVPPASIALRRLAESETLATGWSGTILVAALVRRSTVREIDPRAHAEMVAGPRASGLVWYVRGLETAYDPARYPLGHAPPRLSWAVVDEATGTTLARGFEAGPGTEPATVDGLPVRGVEEVLDARLGGGSADVVAVAGWLRAWADPRACTSPIAGLPGNGCPRTAILAAGPWSDDPATTPSAVGPHLDATVPPGVVIPDRAIGLAVADLGPPPPVVVIGRFAAGAAGCARDPGSCPRGFTIEAVTSVSGQSLTPGRVVATGVTPPAGDQITAAVGDPDARPDTALAGMTGLLRVVLAPRRDLATIDPAAARALAPEWGGPAAPVWYVRGLDGATSRIRWAVVEPSTGRVLAQATLPGTVAATQAAPGSGG